MTLREIEVYVLKIEADDKEEALEKAYKEIETEEGKNTYHNDSDGESTVYEAD